MDLLIQYLHRNLKISIKSYVLIFQISHLSQEEFEEEGRGLRMGKRILRSLGLVFGCIAVVSLVCCDPSFHPFSF